MSRQWQNLINDIRDATALFLNKHRTSRSIPHPAHWRTTISSQVYTDLLPHHNPMCAWCAVTQQSSIIKHRGDSEKLKLISFSASNAVKLSFGMMFAEFWALLGYKQELSCFRSHPVTCGSICFPLACSPYKSTFKVIHANRNFTRRKNEILLRSLWFGGGQVLELWLPISLQKTLAEHCL